MSRTLAWLAGLLVVVAWLLPFAVRAQVTYTPAERIACEPEILRLCKLGQLLSYAAGNPQGIWNCLREHRREVRPACDAVLKRHGY